MNRRFVIYQRGYHPESQIRASVRVICESVYLRLEHTRICVKYESLSLNAITRSLVEVAYEN